MSIIRECEYCLPEVNDKRTYRKQTEVYDAIGIDVPMCWNCGEVALFERERIIKLLEELDDEEWMGINQNFIALIKGENTICLSDQDYEQLNDAIKGENK